MPSRFWSNLLSPLQNFTRKVLAVNLSTKLIWLNTILLILLVGVFLFKENGFSWKRYLRSQVALLPYSPVKVLSENLAKNEILRFGVIDDSHVGAKFNDGSPLINALKKAKESQVDFVVLIGDISDHAEPAELARAKQILDASQVKYYTVPGNHDTWQRGTQNYEKVFGARYSKTEIMLDRVSNLNTKLKRATLFFIDTTGGTTPGKFVDDEEMHWLEDQMNAPREKDQLIFIFQEAYLNRLPTEERFYLSNYYCKHRINGIFYANSHLREESYQSCSLRSEVDDPVYGFVPTFNPGAIFNQDGFPGIMIMHYFADGQYETERVLLDETYQ